MKKTRETRRRGPDLQAKADLDQKVRAADTRAIQILGEEIQELRDKLADARHLIAQLTKQIEDSGRSYMWTLGALAKANGGEIRIPGSAIDAVQEDDIIENRLDELRDEVVFTIRRPGNDAPSGIILPGRTGR